MIVTKEEMQLLQVILDVGHSYQCGLPCRPNGEAIELMRRWQERGVTSGDFQLSWVENRKRYPTLDGPPSLLPHSPSSSSPPSSHPPKANGSSATPQKKQKLTVESVIDSVRFDLTLHQSLPFRAAWKRWVENRLQLKNPTMGAFQIHMAKCAVMGPRRAIEAIDESIANSWLSIYPPRQKSKDTKPEPSL